MWYLELKKWEDKEVENSCYSLMQFLLDCNLQVYQQLGNLFSWGSEEKGDVTEGGLVGFVLFKLKSKELYLSPFLIYTSIPAKAGSTTSLKMWLAIKDSSWISKKLHPHEPYRAPSKWIPRHPCIIPGLLLFLGAPLSVEVWEEPFVLICVTVLQHINVGEVPHFSVIIEVS